MINPFRFSQLNFDMTCGYIPNSFNIQANMYMDDSIARAGLYNVPIFNMGSYTPYGGVSCPGDFIFNYTLNQAHQQSLQMGGPGIFNSDGSLNLVGNIWGGYGYGSRLGTCYNPFSGIGITPWQTPVVDNGNGNGKTDEERRAEEKMKNNYDKLKELLKAYVDINKDIDEDLKIDINVALEKSGKPEEKYNALKEVFKSINTDDLRKVFPNLNAYRTQLIETGYDFEDSECFEYENAEHAELVSDARQDIKTILETTGNVDYKSYDGLTALSSSYTGENILNLISLWNENKDSKRLILAIQDVVKKIAPAGTGDSESRVLATKELLVPMLEALKDKADACKSKMTKEEKEQLDELKENLGNAEAKVVAKPMTASWDDLSKAFDDLYTFLRKQEAVRINKEISDKYSFLNDIKGNTIDEELIINDTELDLDSEKITDSVIDNYREEATTTRTQKKVASMVHNNVLDEVEIDGVTYYQETKMTGNRDYNRVFAIVDGKVKVVKDAKIVDGKLVDLEGQAVNVENIETEDVEAKDIEADYDKVKEAEEVAASKKEAKASGASVTETMNTRYVNQEKKNEQIEQLNNITKDNIIEFLDGTYSAEAKAGLNLFSTGVKKGYIDKTNGVAIIDAFLACAKEYELENTKHYIKLQEMREKLYNGDKTFNSLIIVSGCSRYVTAIDNCIGILYHEIKKQEIQGVDRNA